MIAKEVVVQIVLGGACCSRLGGLRSPAAGLKWVEVDFQTAIRWGLVTLSDYKRVAHRLDNVQDGRMSCFLLKI